MSERDHDLQDQRARTHALARLATLQRLKDQAKARDRSSMLRSIEKLIELETKTLREAGHSGFDTED